MAASTLRPGDLLAIAEPPGPRWLGYVATAWEAGASVLPIDPRTTPSQLDDLFAAAKPTAVLEDGRVRRLDGEPTEGPGLVVATSGTSGTPKAVELSAAALTAAVRASADRLGLRGHESWTCPIPVAHVGGFLVILRGVLLGAPVTFDLEDRAAWASVVPTQLRRLVDRGADLSHRSFLVGGDRLDPAVREQAEARGARVVATYGMSETGGGVVYDGTPLDGVLVRTTETGRIEIAGPTLCTRYRDGRALPVTDGWLRTNDRGRFEDGLLVVEGRLDDVVIIGGEKFSRAAIEAVVRAVAGTGDVVVDAEKDPEYGARLRVRYSGAADIQTVREAIRGSFGGLAAGAAISSASGT